MSTNPIPSQHDNWSVRCYRQLMRFYPKEFTTAFGESVDQAFRDLARDAVRKHGWLGMVLLWFRIVPDFVFSAVELFSAKAGDFLKWSFRVRWLLACSAGFGIGLTLSGLLAWQKIPHDVSRILLWLILGVFQSFVLSDKICRARWILFSTAAAALNFALERTVYDPIMTSHVLPARDIPILLIPAAISGAIIGLFQWHSVRKADVNASRWTLACAAGLYAFWLVEFASSFVLQHAGSAIGFDRSFTVFTLGNFVNHLVAGAIFGLITVGPLERILQPPPVSIESASSALKTSGKISG